MNKLEIRNIVLKYLARAIDDIDPENTDTSKSMVDLGANSIDIVEVVSSSMRELRVKVPRSQLNEITNVDGLVDLLLAAAEAKAAS